MDFNNEPFWDDFEASNGAKENNYMRILFRPGYSVQARELTQIQTILQNQLKSFGDHIFKDGSPVYGGHLTVDNSATYLKLEPTYNNQDIDVVDYLDRVIFNQAGTAKKRAKVLAIYDSDVNPTVIIRYLRGTSFVAGETIGTSSGSLATVAANPSGFGSVVHIDTGVFYVNGYFVYVAAQTLVLDAYSNTPTYRVGLEIDDEVIDESADANLLDPAQESFNYQAPGAHRYKFALGLSKRKLEAIDDQRFFELMRIENGVITKMVNAPLYSRIEDVLARRTYDESGDYVVKPFGVRFSQNTSNEAVITAAIQPGKAYVGGYEFELIGSEDVTINKARIPQTSTDYDLSLEYGNYIITKDLYVTPTKPLPNLESGFVSVDLHCTPNNGITYTSSAYYASYIGTANIVNMNRIGDAEFVTYLDNINLVANTVTATGGSTTTISFPTATYSSINNVYANAQIKIISGSAAGDVRRISSYDGSTKTATVSSAFSAAIVNGVKAEIIYDIININSVVDAVGAKTSCNLTMNVSSKSKYSATSNTFISDPTKSTLLFPLPEGYVMKSTTSIINVDYFYRKFIYNVEFAYDSGSGKYQYQILLEAGGEGLYYGSNGSSFSLLDLLENIVVLNKTTGKILNPLSGELTGFRTTSTNFTLYASSGFFADIYLSLKVNNSEQVGSIRSKTKVGDSTTDSLVSSDLPSGGTAVTGQSSVKINTTNGFIWFTDVSVINKQPNGATSLYVPDVFNIKAIYDSQDTSQYPTPTNSIEITERFFFDSGQRDMYYDHSSIILKPGATPPKGQIVVLCQYYTHQEAKGYFCVKSYSDDDYNNGTIPSYLSTSGKIYNLRDCIDFRPSRTARDSSWKISGFKCVIPTLPMELTYSYYLPRIDSIVLTREKKIKVLEGVSAKNPESPIIPNDCMELYTIYLPPYTANVSDIRATENQHKRYTMKDIGVLESRIKNIEYYTSMTMAEKTSKDTTILYEKDGTQKEKYGILVDSFVDFSVADTNAYDYHAAIDHGALFPVTDINNIDLELVEVPSGAKNNDKTISIAYTELSVIEQLYATSNCSVQPYLYGQFDGVLYLSPEGDSSHSLSSPPTAINENKSIITEPSGVVVGAQTQTDKTRDKHYNDHYRRWGKNVSRGFFLMKNNINRAFSHSPFQATKHLFDK